MSEHLLLLLLRYAFYACEEDDPSDAAAAAASASAADGSAGRLLAAAAGSTDVVRCVGLGSGLLLVAALFQVVLRLWLADLHYRARFETTDRLHRCETKLSPHPPWLHSGPHGHHLCRGPSRVLDVVGYLLLVIGSANIKSYHQFGSSLWELAAFIWPTAAAQLLWLLRWLEIALLSHDEESRRPRTWCTPTPCTFH